MMDRVLCCAVVLLLALRWTQVTLLQLLLVHLTPSKSFSLQFEISFA